ncbi:protein of unknown function [Methylocaldum szegediense]|uniref:Uncharacterized protein n=1 Tax=Methylocaldum szegediense TaxID=73780 RepID=A0ABM9I137_9GAMM|nr:protein of unknown function [Methylocaldum szegediense]
MRVLSSAEGRIASLAASYDQKVVGCGEGRTAPMAAASDAVRFAHRILRPITFGCGEAR